MRRCATFIVVLSLALPLAAQQIQVNRQNKTIYVTAESTANKEADIAQIAVGYETYAEDQRAAFEDVAKHGQTLLEALEKSGVDAKQVRTAGPSVGMAEPEEHWTTAMKAARRFHADQTWTLLVPAERAASIVEASMASGANHMGNVVWLYSDPVSIQAEASKAALAKAKRIADQMAQGLGAKLGELVYASNESPATNSGTREAFIEQYWKRSDDTKMSDVVAHKIVMRPGNVERRAIVYAVFAIE